MLLEGIVTYILRDKETGEVKYKNTIKNTPTRAFFFKGEFLLDRLVISTSPTAGFPASGKTNWLYNCIYGQDIPGVPSLDGVFSETTPPMYVEYKQRFTAPVGSDRTIYAIGICEPDTGSTGPFGGADYEILEPQFYVNLSTPCVQTTTEILDIFYTIRFDLDPSSDLSLGDVILLARRFRSSSATFPTRVSSNWNPNVKAAIQNYGYLFTNQFNDDEVLSTSSNYQIYDVGIGKLHWQYSNGISDNLGRAIGTLAVNVSGNTSEGGRDAFHRQARQSSDPYIQTIIPHGSSATLPFYDALNDAAGDGIVSIDDSSYVVQNFPEMYRIDIDATGPVGTSTYRFGVRNFLGFAGGSYQELYQAVPFFFQDSVGPIGDVTAVYDEIEMAGIVLQEYIIGQPVVLAIKASLLQRFNIVTGKAERWGNNHGAYSSANGLPATFITQVEVDLSGNIWVACRDTGLYRISADGLTIDFFDATTFGGTPTLTNNCYGVDIGNGKIWAAFNGGLAYTTDNGVSWTTIDDTTIPAFVEPSINGDWSLIKFIRADRTSATDDIAVMAWVANDLHLYWWSLSTPTVAQYSNYITGSNINSVNTYNISYFSNTPCRYNRRVVVSDQGTWAAMPDETGKIEFLTHGSTTPTVTVTDSSAIGNTYSTRYVMQFVQDKDGNEAILARSTTVDGAPMFAYPDGSLTNAVSGGTQNYAGPANDRYQYFTDYFVHIGGGVCVSVYDDEKYGLVTQCIAVRDDLLGGNVGEALLWNFYGWDGGSWVLNHPGSKPTHSSSEPLHSGLTISFDNNGDQFVAGDYYTTFALDGIVLDGTVQFDSTFRAYKSQSLTTTDFEPSIVPAAGLQFVDEIPVRSIGTDWLQGWVDTFNVTTSSQSIYRTSTSVNPGFPAAVDGRGRSAIDLDGDFTMTFTHRFLSDSISYVTDRLAFVAGMIDPSFIGQAHVDDTHITHGIFFDYSGSSPQIHVRESGVNVFTWPETLEFNMPYQWIYNLFSIKRVGTEIQYYYRNVLMYTSSVPLSGPQRLEVLITGRGGFEFGTNYPLQQMKWGRSITDHFVRIGNSTLQTGYFDPKLHATEAPADTQVVDIKLDGQPVTFITDGDVETPLTLGQVSLFRNQGLIRCSPADVGKTITGTITYVKIY